MPVWIAVFLTLCAMAMARPAIAADRIVVFAAASLKGALDEAAEAYPDEVVISYGGSGAMARQVALGAPADVVILAHQEWMNWLLDQGIVDQSSYQNLWGNALVLVGAEGVRLAGTSAPEMLETLDGGRMAVGQVASVPAGIYSREWMVATGLWDVLRHHLAETENVRAALALVARGETPLGIVYASDARAEKVTVLHRIDPKLHAPIVYPAALVHSSSGGKGAEFLTFLADDPQGIFARHGFVRLATP